MIVTEKMTINGMPFVKTYSTGGYMVQRDGVRYSEAIDPAELNRVYTETDEPVEGYAEEATAEDYQSALREMGVEV